MLPPNGFQLTTMPFEEICEKPSRVLLAVALINVGGYARGQLVNQRLNSGLPISKTLRRVAWRRRRAENGLTVVDESRTACLKSIPQPARR